MKCKILKSHISKLCFAFVLSFIVTNTNGQGAICPPNIDFESGDFRNWLCLEGYVEATSDFKNIVHLNPTAPISVHKIIPASNKELDPYGKFPVVCPNGSEYSVRLGDNLGGYRAEGLSYTFVIPANVQFAITYNYAVVLQNPNHTLSEQPRFRARVIDVNADTEIDCVSFDFAASSSLPGFKVSSLDQTVIYKDWTPVTIDLSGYSGKTIRLEFITSDCTNKEHFGYAYVDVNSSCNSGFVAASICEDDNFLTLTAPYGYELYQWFSNNDYSTVISTLRTFQINPLPVTGTTYSLIITPYTGFGCIDTLSATIKLKSKPNFSAGPDRETLCNESIQLGTAANVDYSYSWSPPDKLKNPFVANPQIKNFITTPTNFVVKVTDNSTGCVQMDSVLITPKKCFLYVPSAFTPNGDGLNDVLRPYLAGLQGFKYFSIYNRTGTIVFSTTKEGEGWDGTYKGKNLDSGIFVWLLEYTSIEGRKVQEKGTIVLIR